MGLVKKVKDSNRKKRQGKRRQQGQGSEAMRVGKRKPVKAKANKQKITERKSKLDRVRCATLSNLAQLTQSSDLRRHLTSPA